MYLKLPKYNSEKVAHRECSCGWSGELYRSIKFCPKCKENLLHPGDLRDIRTCANGHVWKGIFKSRCPICGKSVKRSKPIGKHQKQIFSKEFPCDEIKMGLFDGDIINAERKVCIMNPPYRPNKQSYRNLNIYVEPQMKKCPECGIDFLAHTLDQDICSQCLIKPSSVSKEMHHGKARKFYHIKKD
jgi:rRNA maturation protein Nop10